MLLAVENGLSLFCDPGSTDSSFLVVWPQVRSQGAQLTKCSCLLILGLRNDKCRKMVYYEETTMHTSSFPVEHFFQCWCFGSVYCGNIFVKFSCYYGDPVLLLFFFCHGNARNGYRFCLIVKIVSPCSSTCLCLNIFFSFLPCLVLCFSCLFVICRHCLLYTVLSCCLMW